MTILFIDTVHPILEQRLTTLGFTCVDGTSLSYQEAVEAVKSAHGIVIRSRFPMDANFLQYARHLKFIARSGAGMENIDEVFCKQHNIQLFNAPEGNSNAVAEHALGMLLSLCNNFHRGNEEVRQGIWDREGNRGEEVDGKTIGIIGYGNNGSAFAKKLRGFDSKVLVYDKYKTTITNDYVTQVDLDELYAQADVISFHIPQNKETLYWANAAFFDAVRKPIYLLNLSRGKIVDTKSLLDALESGKVKGAGLDVLEFEKASFEQFEAEGNQLFLNLVKHPKVLLTPHVGGWTKESYFKLSDVLADKICDWFDGIKQGTF